MWKVNNRQTPDDGQHKIVEFDIEIFTQKNYM